MWEEIRLAASGLWVYIGVGVGVQVIVLSGGALFGSRLHPNYCELDFNCFDV